MLKQAYHLKLVLQRIGIVVLLYALCRLLFYLFNMYHFEGLGFGGLLWVMFVGLRFDLSAIVYTNSLFIVLHLLPHPLRDRSWYQGSLKVLFYFVNIITLLFAVSDFAYFEFTMKRTTYDVMGIAQDFFDLLPQYLSDFWYLLIILGALLGLAEYLYRKTTIQQQPKINYPIQALVFLLSFVAFGIMARGGLQYIPISPITAAKYVSASKVPLVTNTPFTLMYSLSHKGLEERPYFGREHIEQQYPIYHKYGHVGNPDKKNVVLIIMESLSAEYTGLLNGTPYTPFFDSLAAQSLVCTNAYASGKHSNEGLVAVTASIPALMNEAFINSIYQDNNLKGLATLLKPWGYQSAFYHGGNNGTFGFDYFSKSAGFEEYYGREEYPNDEDYDGNWEIYDDAFFEWYAAQLGLMQQPFCAGIFSLSAHHPYAIPQKYGERFAKGDFEMHQSIQFSDHALRKFFAKAKQQAWFKNTIFVITADHTGPARTPEFQTPAGIYRIPIIFYSADGSLRGGVSHPVQQTDIMPSLLDLLKYDEAFTAFGRSIFRESEERYAFNYLNGIYQIINKDFLLQFDGHRSVALYDYQDDPLLKENILGANADFAEQLNLELKAVIQQYNHALINNRLAGK